MWENVVRQKYEGRLQVGIPDNVIKLQHAYVEIASDNTGLLKMIVGDIHITVQMQPHVISFYGLRQGSGLCSFSSRKYPGTEGTNQNCH